MKRNCKQKEESRKRAGFYGKAEVFEARKMLASSECMNPYESEFMNEYLKHYFLKGANNE